MIFTESQITDSSAIFSNGSIVTSDELERHWDEIAVSTELKSVMGLDLLTPESSPNPSSASLMAFLPLYIVATFHKCRQCGNCCRPNYRKWDKGVVLSRQEAVSLEPKCRLIKKNSQYILPYPCVFLKTKGCAQYEERPYGCRMFPLTSVKSTDGLERRGIIMLCPAAKELYVTATLFLQDLYRTLETARQQGQVRFNMQDLENLKLGYEHNQVGPDALNYMKKLAFEYNRSV
ncbi:Fe-S-cluster containining protein [Dehalogenimonas formicexedens]|uniref:Fe-S-cluster containining protein n=1 Tax=Dehalogenimonas formicexedens TaxID=1839801 RepID=A0A1P8F5E3_9CHLR|nr:Fe-S-cluster containining protein [Dehalogenimonas formicexedens]